MPSNPNTTPIYPKEIIKWRSFLSTTNVTPRNTLVGNVSPVMLGVAGSNGSLIHVIDIRYATTTVSLVARIFTKKVNESAIFLAEEVFVPAGTFTENDVTNRVSFDLPFASSLYTGKGLYLEPGETMYAGVSQNPSGVLIITARGGNY